MSKYDVVTIGSVTQDTYIASPTFRVTASAVSLTGKSQCFPFGTKIILDDFHLEVGGGATNAAATFRRFGFRTAVISRCGDDPSGKFVLDALQQEKIDTSHIQVVSNQKTEYSVIFLNKNGERSIFVYLGVSKDFGPLHIAAKEVNTKWFYVTSLGGNASAISGVVKNKKRGVNIAWNPGKGDLQLPRNTFNRLVRSVDILLVNREEAGLLFGTKNWTAIRRAYQKRQYPVCIVTDGENGSWLFNGSAAMRTTIRKVRAKDTTGAGDAFGSGFVSGLIRKPGDFAHALFVGSANAMSVVQKVGAKHGLVTPSQLGKLKTRIHIT